MTDPSQWKSPSPAFSAALRGYDRASMARLRSRQVRDAIMAPLYHYTPGKEGLEGIIREQQFWFTHYQHLNDDTEIRFGLDIANAMLAERGMREPKLKIFCDMIIDLFSTQNLNSAFEFYIASFSRDRDKLYQWERYGGSGKGFAIGLSPRLFAIEDRGDRKPHENVFVSPVIYGDAAGRAVHRPAIDSAMRIVSETIDRKKKAMTDINKGMGFFREMANYIMSSDLILNSLVVKSVGWEPEHEVRRFIIGEVANLAPYVETRRRGAETVPFIRSDMPLQQSGNIVEIVIGSAAPPEAEEFVYSLLEPFHSTPRSIVKRSTTIVA